MIHDHDRSYYIGASDTKYVMGNWNTQTFRHWWDIKMGFDDDDIDNIYLRTGTLYEPKIMDEIHVITERDRQIIIGRLRVNLDGETEHSVCEIKTVSIDKMKLNEDDRWIPPKHYKDQVQVELFATDKLTGVLYGYGVTDDDYDAVARGETLPIDIERLKYTTITRNDDWLDNEYLPRLWYLCDCLEKEKLPCMEDLHLT